MSSEIYPWNNIPNGRNATPAFRSNGNIHQFLWGYDLNSENPCLLYRLSKYENPKVSLPKLKGIELYFRQKEADTYLIFCLIDRSYEDLFYQFGTMLLKGMTNEISTKDVPKILINRCWRWHSFLHSRLTKSLTFSEQQGLFAELTELSDLIDFLGDTVDLVHSWVGPIGESQDFNFPQSRLEIKSSRPSNSHFMRISSENQLEVSSFSPIFICHSIIEKVKPTKGTLLTVLIESIVGKLQLVCPQSITHFSEKLLNYGFSWEHDYSDSCWHIVFKTFYHVSSDFPLVSPITLPNGIKDVPYSISTSVLDSYIVDKSQLINTIFDRP